MSRYDQECQRVATLAQQLGYTAITIDYEPCRIGHKSRGYEITAQGCNKVRVLLARNTSWAKTYAEAMEYLSN
jgi:hypothetical protein